MSEPKVYVIGIGGLKRSGKDTFARVIVSAAVTRGFAVASIAFADPLRRAAAAAYGVDVSIFTDDARKDTVCEAWGITYRQMLINLGEAMRGVNEDHWVKAWRQSVAGLIRPASHFFRPSFAGASQRLVLVPDLRRVNEAAAIHDAGGVTVLIRRPGVVWDGQDNELPAHLAQHRNDIKARWLGCEYATNDPLSLRPMFDRSLYDAAVDNSGQPEDLRLYAIALLNGLGLTEKTC